MPMLHILSTHGLLLSFDLLNLQPSVPGLCSPPQSIIDKSGVHYFTELSPNATHTIQTPPQQQVFKSPTQSDPQSNLTFNIPDSGATSTPTKLVGSVQAAPKNLFGSLGAPSTSLFGGNNAVSFGAKPQVGLTFGDANKQATGSSFGSNLNFGSKPTEPIGAPAKGLQSPALAAALQAQSVQKLTTQQAVQPRATVEQTKPFITVPPSYTPPASNANK